MAISAIAGALVDAGLETGVAAIAAGAIEGSIVGGAASAALGGNVGEGVLLGAFTGGIASPVSGEIASIAPGLSPLENAIGTGAISGLAGSAVSGGNLEQGALLGGAGAGIWSVGSAALSSGMAAPANVPNDATVVDQNTGDVYTNNNGTLTQNAGDTAVVTANNGLVVQDGGGNLINSTDTSYSAQQLGYNNVSDYTAGAAAGYTSGSDFYTATNAGFSPTDASSFNSIVTDPNGYTAQQIGDLANSGYSASQIQSLNTNGISSSEAASLVNNGFSASDVASMSGTDAASLYTLSNNGYTADQLNTIMSNGYSASDINQLSNLGLTADQINGIASSGTSVTDAVNNVMANGLSAYSASGAYQSPADIQAQQVATQTAQTAQTAQANGWQAYSNAANPNAAYIDPATNQLIDAQGNILGNASTTAPVAPAQTFAQSAAANGMQAVSSSVLPNAAYIDPTSGAIYDANGVEIGSSNNTGTYDLNGNQLSNTSALPTATTSPVAPQTEITGTPLSEPTGTAITENANGTWSSSNGVTYTANPDGSFTGSDSNIYTENADGTLTPTGETIPSESPTTTPVQPSPTPEQSTPVTNPDGSITTQNPDGSLTTQNPDGSVTTQTVSGTTTTYPDGTTTSDNGAGTPTTTTNPDGTTTTTNPTTSGSTGSEHIPFELPDGSMGYIQDGNIYDANGTLVAAGSNSTAGSVAAGTNGGAIGAIAANPATNGTTASNGAIQPVTPWTWGTAAAPINPGLNPGLWAGAAKPAYAQNGLADTYNWGVQNQNGQQPGTQYGVPYSAVGGNEYLNIPQFIQQTIGTPQYQYSAGEPAPVQPYTTPAFNPPSSYYTTATQNVASPIGQSFGGAAVSPYTMSMPYLTPTVAVAPAGATNAGQPTAG